MPWRVQGERLLRPLHKIDSQSHSWGVCITPASGGEELHLYSTQVIKDLSSLDPSSLASLPFRGNGSQLRHVCGFPHLRVLCVIRHPLRMRWAFPVTVLLHLPGRGPQRCAGSSIVPCPGFPFRASGAVYHRPTFSTAGTSGASQVLR